MDWGAPWECEGIACRRPPLVCHTWSGGTHSNSTGIRITRSAQNPRPIPLGGHKSSRMTMLALVAPDFVTGLPLGFLPSPIENILHYKKPAHLTSSFKDSENRLGCALGMSKDWAPWVTSRMSCMEWSHAQQFKREKDYLQRPKPKTNTSWPMQVWPHDDIGAGYF